MKSPFSLPTKEMNIFSLDKNHLSISLVFMVNIESVLLNRSLNASHQKPSVSKQSLNNKSPKIRPLPKLTFLKKPMTFNGYICTNYTLVPTTECQSKHNMLLETKTFSSKENTFSPGKLQCQGSPHGKKLQGSNFQSQLIS